MDTHTQSDRQLDFEPQLEHVRQQIAGLESRLVDLATGFLAVSEGKFDANVYRKSLEFGLRDQVFKRLLAVVAGFTLLGSFGLGALILNRIDDKVESELRNRQVDLAGMRDQITAQRLLLLLQEAIREFEEHPPEDAGDEAAPGPVDHLSPLQQIRQERELFVPLLKNWLALEPPRLEHVVASRYVIASKDSELLDSAWRLCQRPDLAPALHQSLVAIALSADGYFLRALEHVREAVRANDYRTSELLTALARRASDTFGNTDDEAHDALIELVGDAAESYWIDESEIVEVLLQTEDEGVLLSLIARAATAAELTQEWSTLVRKLSRLDPQSFLSNPHVVRFLKVASRSEWKDGAHEASVMLLALDRDEFKRAIRHRRPWSTAERISEDPARRTPEDFQSLRSALASLELVSESRSESDSATWSDPAAWLLEPLVPGFLARGAKRAYLDYVYDEERMYPWAAWASEIAPMFPAFLKDRKLGDLTADQQANCLDEFEIFLHGLVWTEHGYQSEHESAFVMLAEGHLELFFKVMGEGYFAKQDWFDRVLPRFRIDPDFDALLKEIDNEAAQDQLWGWARDNELTWDAAAKQFFAEDE